MLRPPFAALPPHYAAARAFHMGVHPDRPDVALLKALRAANPGALISVEPFTHAAGPGPMSPERVRALVSAGDIFSPNEVEAASIVGPGTLLELVKRLAAAGAKVVCLRRGADGAAGTNTYYSPCTLYSAQCTSLRHVTRHT
jgi:sugar/nucleoside kinase (ribokinase family)